MDPSITTDKSVLKVLFCDFWRGFSSRDNLLLHLLQQNYEVELSNEPDVVIYSCFGREFKKHKCHRIFYTGENIAPDYRACDFSLSFKPTVEGKNLRLPLYKWYSEYEHSFCYQRAKNLKGMKFCAALISNPKCSVRNEFLEKLSEYKRVDSGGSFRNNIGYKVVDKLEFIKNYKFVISFENCESDGYTTEKIFEPLMVGSIPIYWGNPLIGMEFNAQRFVNFYDHGTIDKVISFVKFLDTNDDVYLSMIHRPIYINNEYPKVLSDHFLAGEIYIAIQRLLRNIPIAQKRKWSLW